MKVTADIGKTSACALEMLLLGLGGGATFDVVHILRKGRQQVTDCIADIEAERADTDPKAFFLRPAALLDCV